MPSVTLPAVSVQAKMNATAKTYADFKKQIAAVVSGSGDPLEVQADLAFEMALDWLLEHDWEYYLQSGADLTTVAGTASYTIDTRTKSVHNVRVSSGNSRPLFYIRGDKYDKHQYEQTATSTPVWYTLERFHTSAELRLLPTPSVVETVELDIYRDPARPSKDADVPDVARWMERPLILQGQALVTMWRGGQRGASQDLIRLAEDAKRGAWMRDSEIHDEDVGLDPSAADIRRWPVDHPMYREYDY